MGCIQDQGISEPSYVWKLVLQRGLNKDHLVVRVPSSRNHFMLLCYSKCSSQNVHQIDPYYYGTKVCAINANWYDITSGSCNWQTKADLRMGNIGKHARFGSLRAARTNDSHDFS